MSPVLQLCTKGVPWYYYPAMDIYCCRISLCARSCTVHEAGVFLPEGRRGGGYLAIFWPQILILSSKPQKKFSISYTLLQTRRNTNNYENANKNTVVASKHTMAANKHTVVANKHTMAANIHTVVASKHIVVAPTIPWLPIITPWFPINTLSLPMTTPWLPITTPWMPINTLWLHHNPHFA